MFSYLPGIMTKYLCFLVLVSESSSSSSFICFNIASKDMRSRWAGWFEYLQIGSRNEVFKVRNENPQDCRPVLFFPSQSHKLLNNKHNSINRPKKNNVVFPITGPKINGSVGRKIFFLTIFFINKFFKIPLLTWYFNILMLPIQKPSH